jgi:hypothetical protein
MRQSKFTETQIVSILKEADDGAPSTRSGGTTGSAPRRTTNGRPSTGLGCLRCEAPQRTGAREHPAQTDVCGPVVGECGPEGCHRKKALRPAERREVVTHLVTVQGLRVQRACRAVGLGRATYYRPLVDWARRDAPVIVALTALVAAKSRWGFWKSCDRLWLDGHPWTISDSGGSTASCA